MKYAVRLLMFLLLLSSTLLSQWQSRLPGNGATSNNNKFNLNQISKAFNDYWAPYNVEGGYYYEDGVKKKATGWKQFKREEWFWAQRVNPNTGEFPNTNAAIEMLRVPVRLNKSGNASSSSNWTNLGTNSSAGGYAGIGRINCVAFHPTDVNTYWVGSPSGGIWKTTDNGSTWICLNNNMPVIGVSSIVIPSDYATSNTIYIATGDRDGGSVWTLGTGMRADNNSLGVYKSIDGGATWSATGLNKLNSDNKIIGKLLLASDNTTLYASVYLDGIYKSVNSGTTWTKIANITSAYVIDMEFKPGDDNTIYASTKSVYSNVETFIYKTTDAGTTWRGTTSAWSSINKVFMGLAGSGRIELAVTTADPTVVYAVYSYPSKLKGIYKSTDSGETFTMIWDGQVANQNLLGYQVDASDLTAGQGTYDLCIAASPGDANVVFVGGINTWMTSDGGSSWKIKTHWSTSGTSPNRYNKVHADKHALEFQNANVLFEGNDGGVYRAQLSNNDWFDPGSDYVDKTNGLVISQIYRLGVSKTDVTKVITGLQDNGAKLYNGGVWKDVRGGDGMECIIDHTNPLYMYATYVSGEIYRNTNGYSTLSQVQITANIPGGQPAGAWVTPYVMDPANSQILYAGFDQVWKTTDRGDSWTSISTVLSSSDKLWSLAVAPSDSKVIYAADRTHMWRTTDADAATPTWTSLTLPTTSVSLTYIAVKADDPLTVWITYGGFSAGNKVFQSTDGGNTWTNISGTLPNVPVLCITQNVRLTGASHLFIGTDVGVQEKVGANDWASFNTGLPNVIVTELELYYGTTQSADRLRAATYGRGLWETPINNLATKYIVTSSSYSPVAGTSVTITAQLADANNYSVANPGVTVNWSKSNSSGSFSSATSLTDATGKATITFTTHSAAGTSTTVTANDGILNGTSSSITTVAGVATKYIVTSSSYNPAAGNNVTITAQLADANNNPVTTSGINVNWTKSNANGAFSSANSITDASGIAVVTLTTHSLANTITTVTANDGTLSGVSPNITTVVGPPAKYIVTSSSYNPNAGTSVTVNAQLADINNNNVQTSGITVNWSKSDPNGSFASATSSTNASGVASVLFTSHTVAGTTTTVTANDGSVSGTSPIITTTPGSVSPIVITLLSPTNNSTGISIAPALSWSGAGSGSPVYTLLIGRDSSFTNVVYGPVTVTSPYQLPESSALSNSTVYYWKITATLPGPVVSSAKGKFTTIYSTVPYLVSPVQSTAIVGGIVNFVWTLPIVGLQYCIELDNDSNYGSQVAGFPTARNSMNYFSYAYDPSVLTPGTYYWRVKAYNQTGELVSVSSSGRLVIPGLPTAIPSYPVSLTNVYSSSPTIYWYLNNYLYPNTLYYRVRYGNTSGVYNSISAPTTSTYYTLNNLMIGSSYYYVVDASSSPSFTTYTTSAEGSFSVFYSNVTSIPIYKSYPISDINVYTLTPTLYWYLGLYMPGVLFDLQLDNTSNSFPSPEISVQNIPNYYYTTQSLVAGERYWWRVKISGSPTWSGTESFTVHPNSASFIYYPFATIPMLDKPVTGSVIESQNSNVSWLTKSTDQLEYQVVYSSDPTLSSGVLSQTLSPTGGITGWITANNYPLNGLLPGVTYYWQVRSRSLSTSNDISNYSTVGRFTVSPGNEPVVALPVNPISGSIINSNEANLSWMIPAKSSSALLFDIEISKNSDMSASNSISNIETPNYKVTNLASNQKYYWRVRTRTNTGLISDYSYKGEFYTGSVTGESELINLPTKFELVQNYPNPFNPSTVISFSIKENTYVTLRVFDILGREVKTMVSKEMNPGNFSVSWEGEDNSGNKVTTGTYVYTLSAGNFISTKKMILVK